MVELATLQAVSYIMGSLGVFVAAVYYILNIQNNRRNQEMAMRNQELMLKAQQQTLETRQIGLMDSIIARSINLEGMRSNLELLRYEWTDYEDFEKKYGSENNVEAAAKRYMVWNAFNSLGMMLRKGMVDAEDIFDVGSVSIFLWAKYKPIIEENRRRYNGQDYLKDFEYLSEQMMKLKLSKDPSYRIPETLDKYVTDQ